ncbi:uncharacterized protein LOC132700800 isoform X2 [Cylas formicarius]|uniref:uncharacterized protein LOC132700800 isoform X2 n=1 Tax=Cylas formicarius TaxID=197179 RepID=UPI002958CEDD|nr:uncharacterized protein LOC132700800 isoform X2 [Cylas formicarius]
MKAAAEKRKQEICQSPEEIRHLLNKNIAGLSKSITVSTKEKSTQQPYYFSRGSPKLPSVASQDSNNPDREPYSRLPLHQIPNKINQEVLLNWQDSHTVSKTEFNLISDNITPNLGINQLSNPVSSTGKDMAEGTPKAAPEQLRVSESRILYTLNMIREPVVEYQEARGIPRTEDITFVTLVTSLCSQSYTAAITILVMLWNLMPLVDGFVYFIRFLLDKLIDILQTQDTKDRAIKTAIFVGELTVIMFLIFMIVGLIFMPVYVLMVRLFSKVFSMVVW